MANPEHLAKLKEGVEAWNAWRRTENCPLPDLIQAKLSGASLAGANLRQASLNDADLSGADLRWVDFFQADLNNADLRDAELHRAMLGQADLRGANLGGAELSSTNLEMARLKMANFSRAHLFQTNLRSTDMSDVNLSHATVTETVFHAIRLNRANFTGAHFFSTVFTRVDLGSVEGLNSITHEGPSSIGVDTIHRSGGKISDQFLRGCGVPEAFVAYAKSLVGAAIEFYSAFISYSTKDEEFAERFHADLQMKGVRCWFAPEDLKIGDRFRARIDESIRMHDKLLIVLSENSIASPWVEDEVESAIEREHRDKKTVLFPIRLDHAVMDTSVAWAASLRRVRHIGDFSRWKEHDAYSKALARLMRDLKAGDSALR